MRHPVDPKRVLVGGPAVLFMAVSILLGAASAGAGEALPEADREAIEGLLQEQEEAWNRGDLVGFMQVYEQSEELLFASGNRVNYGWLPTLEGYQQRYDTPEKMGVLAFEVLQVDGLGKEHAKVLGRWRLTREADSPHGLFTLIFERRDDTWRIIHDHTSAASE